MSAALKELQQAYEKAEIQVPKKKEHFLLDHTHPIWKWLVPPLMLVIGAIICWVGGYE